MPSAAIEPVTASPNPSRPQAPKNRTSAPIRRADTAWLAPFPPAAYASRLPNTVSPGSGGLAR